MMSFEYLDECFAYNEKTGVITWKERPLHHFKTWRQRQRFNVRYAGKQAGCLQPGGYLRIQLDNKFLKAHTISWSLHHKKQFSGRIYHLNGKKSDNRIENLTTLGK